MGISIQTNVTSLIAQENLRTNTAFQNNTIEQLTSGYRINSSGDDAAGLAVANQYRSTTAQLTQGVLNANNGVSVFQTVDGGLSNISQILERLNTLATESASGTFNGDRSTINNEYQSLVGEIDRQAANVGLNSGGVYNSALSIFIGGGNTQANSQVNVDLSGVNNAVDATSLGLAGTTVAGGGTGLSVGGVANNVDLNDAAVQFLAGSGSQTFTFNTVGPGGIAFHRHRNPERRSQRSYRFASHRFSQQATCGERHYRLDRFHRRPAVLGNKCVHPECGRGFRHGMIRRE